MDNDLKQYVKTFFKSPAVFVSLEHSQFFFRLQSAAQPGAKGASAPFIIRGTAGARQFNSFNVLILNFRNLLSLFMWLQKRAKSYWNGVKIAIVCGKTIKQESGGSALQALSVIRLSCISLFSMGPELDNLCAKIFYFCFQPPSS